MNCKYCGSLVNPTDHFCGICGKAIIPDNQVTTSNTSQFNNTNTQQNVNSFDNYNYNPNRYKPIYNAIETNIAHQITFAHSIAISLLIVMLIIFIIVALIYYSTINNVASVSNTAATNVVVYQPTYQNATSTSSAKSVFVFSEDKHYKVEFDIPSTFSAQRGSTETERLYQKSSSKASISICIYPNSLIEVVTAFKNVGYTITSQKIKTISQKSYTQITGYYIDSSSTRQSCDIYIYELESKYMLTYVIEPASSLTTNELNTFLDITVY